MEKSKLISPMNTGVCTGPNSMNTLPSSLHTRTVARAFSALIAGLLIASCATKPPPPPEPPVDPNKPKPLYEWNGKGRTASHLKINIDEQKVSVFSGNEQIGWATVATGLTSYPTPVGDYKVIEKVADKKSNLFGKTYNSSGKVVNSDAKMGRDPIPQGGRFEGAKMAYYLRLTGDGVGMHAGPIPRPGHRASHGCIRMPRPFAPLVFASVPVGTPVTITGSGPSYAAYMKKQQAAAARLYAARKKKAEAEKTASPDAAAAPTPDTATSTPAASATSPATPAPASTEPKPAAAAPTTPAMKEPTFEIKPATVVPPAGPGQP
jgi:L,D-transpeptidase catalytic domain